MNYSRTFRYSFQIFLIPKSNFINRARFGINFLYQIQKYKQKSVKRAMNSVMITKEITVGANIFN